ncbi:hypothetical protein FQR65_LT16793 [Abscondita terminalis]|nr:hypothetical protein FQR65_LT16793 [Abscondita terminalis]
MTLQNLKYSVLDLAYIAQGNTIKQTLNNSLDLARYVEGLGYTRFWLAEHHNMVSIASSATSVLIGYIPRDKTYSSEQFGTLESLIREDRFLESGRCTGNGWNTAYGAEGIPQIINERSRGQFHETATYFSERKNKNGQVYTDSAWLAAELGLPYAFAGHFAPDQMGMAFKIYRENYKPSDRFSKPYIIAATNIIAADTDEEAEYLSTTL